MGVQNEAGQRLTELCQENALVIANTRDDSTDGHHQMVNIEIKLITFFAAEEGKALYSQQKQALELTVAHSDHELLIAKFRLKLKEVGKTSRPVRYDPNQIPYDYIVEMTNRFKGLELVDSMPEELWMDVCNIVQKTVTKTIPNKSQSGCLKSPCE